VPAPPHRDLLWQQCEAVCRGRTWRSQALRHVAAAEPRCRRYRVALLRVMDSAAPEHIKLPPFLPSTQFYHIFDFK